MPTIKYAPVFDEGLIKFLKDCAGVWAAIMLFGATRFFSNGTNLIGVAVCCSLSALLAFVYSLYLNFLSNMRKMQVRQSNVHRFVIGSQSL